MSKMTDITSWEIFIWALYELGGGAEYIDIEDVSLKCFELAPKRFSWRTRPDLPDYKKCAKALQVAEALKPPLLLKTQDAFGRQLTAEGQDWAKRNSLRMQHLFSPGKNIPEPKRRLSARMLTEIEQSVAYSNWTQNGTISNEKWRIADVLKCSPDSNKMTWANRLESARATAFSSQNDLVMRFLDEIKSTHPDWFGE